MYLHDVQRLRLEALGYQYKGIVNDRLKMQKDNYTVLIDSETGFLHFFPTGNPDTSVLIGSIFAEDTRYIPEKEQVLCKFPLCTYFYKMCTTNAFKLSQILITSGNQEVLVAHNYMELVKILQGIQDNYQFILFEYAEGTVVVNSQTTAVNESMFTNIPKDRVNTYIYEIRGGV